MPLLGAGLATLQQTRVLPRQVLTLIPSAVGVYFLSNTNPLFVARLASNMIPENLTLARIRPKVLPSEGTLALDKVINPPLPLLSVALAPVHRVLSRVSDRDGSPVRLILRLILLLLPAMATKKIPEDTW